MISPDSGIPPDPLKEEGAATKPIGAAPHPESQTAPLSGLNYLHKRNDPCFAVTKQGFFYLSFYNRTTQAVPDSPECGSRPVTAS